MMFTVIYETSQVLMYRVIYETSQVRMFTVIYKTSQITLVRVWSTALGEIYIKPTQRNCCLSSAVITAELTLHCWCKIVQPREKCRSWNYEHFDILLHRENFPV